jgi:hypothetical protein
MQRHTYEIARGLAPKAHAVVVLDQAGWRTTGKLRLPDNLSLRICNEPGEIIRAA